MKASELNLNIHALLEVKCAHIYITRNIVIVEIQKHTNLGKKEMMCILDAIERNCPDLSNMHYISNRTEIYSLKPIELVEMKGRIDQFKSYSVVNYESAGDTNLVFERMFLKKEIVKYSSLVNAIRATKSSHLKVKNDSRVA